MSSRESATTDEIPTDLKAIEERTSPPNLLHRTGLSKPLFPLQTKTLLPGEVGPSESVKDQVNTYVHN